MGRLAPAYYEASVSAFLDNKDAIKSLSSSDVVNRLQRAFASDDFKNSTGPGANTIPKLHARIEAVSRVFQDGKCTG